MNTNRKTGIDILRIVASFMIVLFHSLTQGGVLEGCDYKSSNYYVAWFLMSFTMGGVNLFALISGYVSYSDSPKKTKYSRILELWFTVVFYSLLSDFIFDLINPEWVSPVDYLVAVTPITNCSFWYFTCFVGLSVLKPILDNGIRACEEKTLIIINVLIIVLFSLIEFVTQSFGISFGFSILWLASLYIVGATVKRLDYEKKIKTWTLLALIIILGVITFLGGLFISEHSFMDIQIDQQSLFRYNSPTVMISSICYLIIFAKIKVKVKYEKIIRALGISTFSVYIVNCTDVFWNNVMSNMFFETSKMSLLVMLFEVFRFIILFVIFVLLFDVVRRKIFTILRIDKLCSLIDKKI
ncbi:MAG: acyltransferase family protein [Eubacterium sp.]|nr:acyltransferase family protein [Eubacterium sp.]